MLCNRFFIPGVYSACHQDFLNCPYPYVSKSLIDWHFVFISFLYQYFSVCRWSHVLKPFSDSACSTGWYWSSLLVNIFMMILVSVLYSCNNSTIGLYVGWIPFFISRCCWHFTSLGYFFLYASIEYYFQVLNDYSSSFL